MVILCSWFLWVVNSDLIQRFCVGVVHDLNVITMILSLWRAAFFF